MVDLKNSDKVDCEIKIIEISNPIPDGRRSFIGTAVIEPFVCNVFDRFQ